MRLLRAVRFATVLGFKIEKKTLEAVKKNSDWLIAISKERIRDEFVKVINSDNAYDGIMLLYETGLLKHIVPELLEGVSVGQNLHHIYTVWEHNTLALKYAAGKNYSLEVRLGSLFHDIGKPQTKRGDGKYSTFYGHDVVGAKLRRNHGQLSFQRNSRKVVNLSPSFTTTWEVTESSVGALLVNTENINDLIKVREAAESVQNVQKQYLTN